MTEDADRAALVTALTTEHMVLQTAANATVADAAARSSLYVFALSSSLVAIGFISQSPELLPVMVSIVLPALFLLGVLTVMRLVDSSLENQQCEAGIAASDAPTGRCRLRRRPTLRPNAGGGPRARRRRSGSGSLSRSSAPPRR